MSGRGGILDVFSPRLIPCFGQLYYACRVRSPPRSAPGRATLRLAVVALVAVASIAACSSSSEKRGTADGGASDGALVDEVTSDAGVDTGAGADVIVDVPVLPDAFIDLGPDACFLTGASCLDDSNCCSSLCVDGGCMRLPVQQ